ncbi:MAG: hypothetical protein KBA26_02090 [Candidatus Delongbacteria bacterium]|nr:hypothetical protein [Candidatus Delongbacteria bacterium]
MNRSWPIAPVWMIVIQFTLLQFMGARGYVLCTTDHGRTALELCTTTCECRQITHHTCPISHASALTACHQETACQDIPILDKIKSLNPLHEFPKCIDLQSLEIDPAFPPLPIESRLTPNGTDPPLPSVNKNLDRLKSVILII